MPKIKSTTYHYTECGLDHVFIDVDVIDVDDVGNRVFRFPAINRLHRAIAEAIIESGDLLDGKEIRFLRTEMGMTQAELAKLLDRNSQTVARWEKGEKDVDRAQDTLIRQLAAERIVSRVLKTTELLGSERIRSTSNTTINLKHKTDGKRHKYMLAA